MDMPRVFDAACIWTSKRNIWNLLECEILKYKDTHVLPATHKEPQDTWFIHLRKPLNNLWA